MQKAGSVHEIALAPGALPSGSGAADDHEEPFQVVYEPLPETATHEVGLAHETSTSAPPNAASAVAGPHDVPSKIARPGSRDPATTATAAQNLTDGQDSSSPDPPASCCAWCAIQENAAASGTVDVEAGVSETAPREVVVGSADVEPEAPGDEVEGALDGVRRLDPVLPPPLHADGTITRAETAAPHHNFELSHAIYVSYVLCAFPV